MSNKESEVKMLHEAPVNGVAPLHHDWTKHYFNDDAEQSTEEEVKKDGSEENS